MSMLADRAIGRRASVEHKNQTFIIHERTGVTDDKIYRYNGDGSPDNVHPVPPSLYINVNVLSGVIRHSFLGRGGVQSIFINLLHFHCISSTAVINLYVL